MKKPKILIVEDETLISLHIERLLKERGYDVAGTAATGEEALALIESEHPDLVLMDIVLEGEMDGIAAAREIKRRYDVPLIYLTAHSDEYTLNRAKETEPYGYILKPVNHYEVFSAIEVAIYKNEMERRLRESEEKYRNLVENINDIVFSLDRDGNITFISRQVEQYFGYSHGELQGQKLFSIIHGDDLEHVLGKFNECKRGITESIEFRVVTKGGETRWFRCSSKPVFNDEGFFGLSGVMSDVTDRKKFERELHFTQFTIDRAGDAAFWMNSDGDIVYVNQATCRYLGYERDELLSLNIRDVDSSITEESWPHQWEKLKKLVSATRLSRLRTKDGWLLPVEVTGNYVEFEGRGYNCAFARDIVDRIMAQAQQRRLISIIENSRDFIGIASLDGEVIYLNRAGLEIVGLGEEEYKHTSIFDYVEEPERSELEEQVITEMMKTGISRGEGRLRHFKTGEPIDVDYNVFLTRNPETDEPNNIAVVMRDITERKEAEKALIDSRQRLYEIIHFLPVATFAIDASGTIIAWNRAIEEMTGFKERDMVGKGDYEYAIPLYGTRRPMMINMVFSPDEELGKMYNYLKREGDSYFVETEVILPDGTPIYLWGKAGPLYDVEGNVIGAIESIRDITDYKETERALRESEELYRVMVQASPDAVIMVTIDGVVTYASQRVLDMLGLKSSDEIIGTKILDFYSPEDMERARSNFYRSMKDEDIRERQYTMVRKDGSRFPIELNTAVLKDDNGEPRSVLGIARDITERKRAEEGLRTSEEKFSKAFIASPHIVIIFELSTARIIEVNDRFLGFVNMTRDEAAGRKLRDIGITISHPDWKTMTDTIRREGSVRNLEITLSTDRGGEYLLSLSGEVIILEGRECFITILEDITEVRQLQREMSSIIEEERFRIGRDLHDDLGQVLTGATFLVQTIKQELKKESHPLAGDIDKIDTLVRQAVMKTRSISRMLSPIEMKGKGFASAVEEMISQIEKVFIISCSFSQDGDIIVEDTHVAANLYYIAREAINNAIKHSTANSIVVKLSLDDNLLMMSIEDDGTGVDNTDLSGGMGLRIMKYRANLIGAQIEYGAGVSGGFRILVTLRI